MLGRVRRGILPIILLGMSTVFAVGAVEAAPTRAQLAEAREAYREGIALEMAGDWGKALAKFRQVAEINAAPQVRFHIGRCQENLGRWTEALGAYRLALAQAREANAKDVIKEAEAALAALEEKIPRVRIELAAGSETASIQLDGVELGAAALREPILVDPGSHRIEASLIGHQPQVITFDVAARDESTVTVPAFVPLEAAAPKPSPTKPAPEPVGEEESATGSTVVPWLITGAGVASLGASGVFYGLRANAISTLEDRCGKELNCTEADRGTYDNGKTYTTVANITLGAGIVGVGLGLTWLLSSGGSSEASAAKSSTQLIVHGKGASLVGAF